MLRRDLPRFSLWAFFSHYRRLRWIEWSFFGLCSCTCSTEWRCSLSLSLSVRVIFHNFVVLDCGFYSVCLSVCPLVRVCACSLTQKVLHWFRLHLVWDIVCSWLKVFDFYIRLGSGSSLPGARRRFDWKFYTGWCFNVATKSSTIIRQRDHGMILRRTNPLEIDQAHGTKLTKLAGWPR